MYQVESFQTEVLVIGGGLSGCMAAIKAREQNAEVIVLESGNTYRSGNAGSGVDHLYSYVPPVHEVIGYTKDEMKRDMEKVAMFQFGIGYKEIIDRFVETSFERITSLEKYGIKMRFEDSHLKDGFRLIPQFHSTPTSIHFEGRDIKVKLTEEMKAQGVRIMNHANVVEIMTDDAGGAVGAIAVSTREDKIIVVEAKKTIIATSGGLGRLVQPANATCTGFDKASTPNSGFGVTLAMNAGAEVTNLEFVFNDYGMGFLGYEFCVGAPGGSWWPAGRAVDAEGNVIVERAVDYDINEPDYKEKYIEQIRKYHRQKKEMQDLLRQGKQMYLDLSEATDAEIDYIKWCFAHEGKCWLYLRNLEYDKVDLRSVRIPFVMNKKVSVHGESTGVLVNAKCEATIPDLYAAGNAMGAGGQMVAPGAVVFGWEAGMQAALAAGKMREIPGGSKKQIQHVVSRAENYRKNSDGESWQDMEKALQNIVQNLAMMPFEDKKMDDALTLVRALKNTGFYAADAHEVSRCFEVLSLIETAEAVFEAIKLRKENLGAFRKLGNPDISDHLTYDEDGVMKGTKIYGLYRSESGSLLYNEHIPNGN